MHGHLIFPRFRQAPRPAPSTGRRVAVATAFCLALAALSPAPQAAVVDLSGVARIVAGGQHTCVVTDTGAVKCWGWNADGQLGDGTTAARLAPVGIASLAGGVVALAAGESHTCALTTAGAVRCWGSNAYGQIGAGAASGSLVPAAVPGLASGVKAIAAGAYHTCALMIAGGVKCWGREGTIGNGTYDASLVPADVSGLGRGTAAIAAGGFHTCALSNGGALRCWGGNVDGQLGDGTAIDQPSPVVAGGFDSGAVAVAAGVWHTCAVTTAGGARCWGNHTYGQVGDGSAPATRVPDPVDVAGLATGVGSLSAGYGHTCALVGGGVLCWGANDAGQLGDGTVAAAFAPVAVTGMAAGVAEIAAGHYHTCARTVAGGARCWGSNDGGQLGDQSDQDRAVALPVTAPTYTLAVTKAGEASGAVVSSPGGIDCGAACAGTFQAGDVVALAAAPATDAYLAGWRGACSGIGACAVHMDADKAVVATFDTRSLVAHFYRSILRRDADAAGAGFWNAEAARMLAIGVRGDEAWYAMAQSFFFSAEYAAFGRGNGDFVTDLYTTFFFRPPDPVGLGFWTGQLAGGLPREAALAAFLFSAEFADVLRSVFAYPAVRAENDTVTDFYRGLLARLPDDGGFAYWLGRFRAAQCAGGEAVTAEVEAISGAFTGADEYDRRARSDGQFVGDLYNAFLRRGGELSGVLFWIGELGTGARSRESVRQAFVASPEFQARVAAIIAQPCLN